MIFVLEERSAWVRPATHTIVLDRDPEFEYLRLDPSGTLRSVYRVWLADACGDRPIERHYLGCFGTCWPGRLHADLLRLFRRASQCAQAARTSPRELRRRLRVFLRERLATAS